MALLTKEQILSVDDLKREEVQVPEWGGSVLVRTMSGTERDAHEAFQIGTKEPLKNFRARVAANTICDENGNLVFSLADIEALGRKSGTALDRVFEAAVRLSRIGEEEIREAGKD